eukprot:8663913-Pyramimonas_sp.AAC.1
MGGVCVKQPYDHEDPTSSLHIDDGLIQLDKRVIRRISNVGVRPIRRVSRLSSSASISHIILKPNEDPSGAEDLSAVRQHHPAVRRMRATGSARRKRRLTKQWRDA